MKPAQAETFTYTLICFQPFVRPPENKGCVCVCMCPGLGKVILNPEKNRSVLSNQRRKQSAWVGENPSPTRDGFPAAVLLSLGFLCHCGTPPRLQVPNPALGPTLSTKWTLLLDKPYRISKRSPSSRARFGSSQIMHFWKKKFNFSVCTCMYFM